MTQEQINRNYDTFQRAWIGHRVDFDYAYGYQCVDLIKQYMYSHFGIPNGALGNAIDYWTRTASVILTKFNRVATTSVVKGDIVVLNGLPGNPYGHIGIATGNQTATTVEILEQNGSTGNGKGLGGDAIRLRSVPKSRIAGILRPKTVTVSGLPAVGSWIRLIPRDVRTTFKAGTADVVGKINVTDNTFKYLVRGHDPKFSNRIIINSASGGGNGVSLALYYLSGAIIPGWERV